MGRDIIMGILDALEQWQDNSESEFGRLPMPPVVYSSEEIHNIELEKIFSKEWICVGHISVIKEAGDYLTFNLATHPVIALRDNTNEIRVYSNVCAHRSSRLLDGFGNCKVIICPYHAWAYELNGKLRGAPRMDKDKVKHVHLNQLKFEVWQGLIFVNLDHNAAPLSPRLSALDEPINKFDFANMDVVHSYEGELACNWKVLVENFCESYHLFKVHKTTLEPFTPTSSVKVMAGGVGYNHHTLDKKTDDKKVSAEDENKEHLSCIYPSMTFALSQSRVLWLS
ncbi:MAG: aromatic ring-hydroxylating dioxygenase subunit alpha, partial [Emcibacteraceae bacterium]|nr:aromatic ring-hydroxylating dioxygenase subunit alpha [Emcibacteraceae bacterium]